MVVSFSTICWTRSATLLVGASEAATRASSAVEKTIFAATIFFFAVLRSGVWISCLDFPTRLF